VSSTIGNPVFFGGFLAMSLPILLAKVLLPPRESTQIWDNPIVTLGLLCFGMAMLFVTLSRGAWLGTAIAFSVVLYFRIKGRRELPRRVPYWFFIILLGVILGAFLGVFIARSGTPRVLDAMRSPHSLESRVEIWKSSLHMISDRPLSGYGLDQTEDWFSHYTTEKLARMENALHDRAHNIYLQWGIDGGALLLLAQLWLFIYVITRGVRSLGQNRDHIVIGFIGAIAGYLVQGVTGIATNELSTFLWFVLGSTVAITSKEKMRNVGFQIAKSPVIERIIVSSLVPLAILAIFPLAAEARYSAPAREARETINKTAFRNAYRAGRYCSVQPYYQYHLARSCLIFARKREDVHYAKLAVKVAKRGLKYAPDNAQLLYMLGSSYLTTAQLTGDEEELRLAGIYLDRARRKAPLFLGTYDDLLEFYIQKGDYGEALKCADFVSSIDGRDAAVYVARSVIYQLRGKDDKAQELFKKASALDPEAEKIKKRLIKASKFSNR
ncbi:MAG TPA: O-antigen ligase family protein, partial [Anaerolineae bacterium]|nr:O-antigen ligase family protein [Anaerolineae bacterium]